MGPTEQGREVVSLLVGRTTKSCSEGDDKGEGKEFLAVVHSTLLLRQIRLEIQSPHNRHILHLLPVYTPSHSLGARWYQDQQVKDRLPAPLKAVFSKNLNKAPLERSTELSFEILNICCAHCLVFLWFNLVFVFWGFFWQLYMR